MKKLFVLVLMALVAAPLYPLHANTAAGEAGAQFDLDKASPNGMAVHRLGDRVVNETIHQMRASYDFAAQGGAVSTITLKDTSTGASAKLPQGAIIRDCILDVVTAPTPTTSPTPSIAIGSGQAANDLKAATGAASYTGLVACVPVGTAATAIKLTADRTMTMAITTTALTAGKFYVIVHYSMSSTL